jgi:hypothetical protein
MKILKYSITLIAVSITAYLAYQAAKIALADISHYPVKNAIAKSTTDNPLSLEKLENLETKTLHSIKLRPNNGEYREYLGRLYYLKAIQNQDSTKLFFDNIQLAYDSHRKASQLRPQWPYSWANMALMKSHLNQFDAGFIHSFNQAEKFGPWEISSNITIAQAGLNGWTHLNPAMQDKTVQAIERIHQQQPHQARFLLKNYDLTYVVCARTKDLKLAESKVCSF